MKTNPATIRALEQSILDLVNHHNRAWGPKDAPPLTLEDLQTFRGGFPLRGYSQIRTSPRCAGLSCPRRS